MKTDSTQVTRRRLLSLLSIGAGSLVAVAAGVPIVGFLLSPMLRKFPPLWQSVGPLENFKIGDTVQVDLVTSSTLPWDGPAKKVGAWLRRDDNTNFTAYSSTCTHLGCPVRWIPSAELFMCPCHGGVYFKDGDVAAGPPPQPLQQFPVRLLDGQVQVQWKVDQVQYVKLETMPCEKSGCTDKDKDDEEV